MMRYWKTFDSWIDARNTRERALMFFSAIAVAAVLLDAVLVEPTLAERKRILLATQANQAEIGKLAAQAQALVRARAVDPDAALKTRLAELQGRISQLQGQLDAQGAELVSPEKMAAVLEKILASSPRLQFVEVKVLPRTTVSLGEEPAKPQAAQPKDAKPDPAHAPNEIYRHGVEVTMRGNYLDLVAYLKTIESQPVRMFWDKVNLSVTEYPTITMRVLVYTISLEKVWLTV